MMNKWIMVLVILVIPIIQGCSSKPDKGELESVGLLVTDTISDQVWGTKGYKGMLKIESTYGVDVFYKERIDSQVLAERAIEEFSHKGVNLVFGHGMEYAEFFNNIAAEYPDMHFISFNGRAEEKNTTSLKFESHAMGFFGGMTAAHASSAETVGIIASYKWQPEIKGFFEGAKFINKDIKVLAEYVNDWDDEGKALLILEEMMKKNVDVVYPAGDGYNVPVIEKLKENQLYAIGYVSDQSELGEDTVLTSTIQHVDKLYLLIAQLYAENELNSGNLSFDFADGVISMSEFNSHVDQDFADKLNGYVNRYIDTGKLPNK